jgi:hypothetical protein
MNLLQLKAVISHQRTEIDIESLIQGRQQRPYAWKTGGMPLLSRNSAVRLQNLKQAFANAYTLIRLRRVVAKGFIKLGKAVPFYHFRSPYVD